MGESNLLSALGLLHGVRRPLTVLELPRRQLGPLVFTEPDLVVAGIHSFAFDEQAPLPSACGSPFMKAAYNTVAKGRDWFDRVLTNRKFEWT